jgi:hypothetical protein
MKFAKTAVAKIETVLKKTGKWFYLAIFLCLIGLFIKDIFEIGGTSYDTDAALSLGQATGEFQWSTVQSILFTLIVKITTFGGAFTDGIIYFQFLAVAGAITIVAILLEKMKISRLGIVGFLMVFRLLQRYQIIIPVALKDVLFGACLLAFVMCVVYVIYARDEVRKKPNTIRGGGSLIRFLRL